MISDVTNTNQAPAHAEPQVEQTIKGLLDNLATAIPTLALNVQILSLVDERALKSMQAFSLFHKGVWINDGTDLTLRFLSEAQLDQFGALVPESMVEAVNNMDPDKAALILLDAPIVFDGRTETYKSREFKVTKPNSGISIRPLEEPE